MSVLWLCVYLTDLFYIDGLMQERRNSIAYALELRLSCTNPSICGTNTTHEVMMCRTPFQFQSVKGASHTAHWKFWPYPLPANLTDWYMAQKQVIRTISRSKGRWSKSFGLLEVFVMSAPWLFDRFTSYEAQIKPMEGWCITHHFQVKRSRSYSVLCLFDRFAWYKA